MNKKNIPYGRQWVDDGDIKEVVKVLKSDWLTQGPKIEEFEKAVAKYCRTKYAVAVSSGTSALYIAYRVAKIKSGDEVITTPLTFAATSNAIVFCGAKPVFVDVEKHTLNIDYQKIEEKITKNTKAIATVDFAGWPCEYEEIKNIAQKHKLLLIEDACHALGAEYKKKKVGSFADMTILSFHPVKHITTGEGGIVLTNDKNFYEKLKVLRNHGMEKKPEKGGWYYEIKNPSFNFRMTDIQCALGLSQLKKIDEFLRRRRQIGRMYKQLLKDKGIMLPSENNRANSAMHIYPIRLDLDKLKTDRKKIFEALRKKGIGVQVHYIPLHMQPFYQKKFGYKKGDFPKAEKYYEEAITLPLFPKMTDSDVKKVAKTVCRILDFYRK